MFDTYLFFVSWDIWRKLCIDYSEARVNIPLLLFHRPHQADRHADWTSSIRAIRSRFCFSSPTRPCHDSKLSQKCLQRPDALWIFRFLGALSCCRCCNFDLIPSFVLLNRRWRSCALWASLKSSAHASTISGFVNKRSYSRSSRYTAWSACCRVAQKRHQCVPRFSPFVLADSDTSSKSFSQG